jgi:protein-S-isoprenylcysteine O-methyltransferase Ste14
VELNRNHYFMAGIFLLLLGMQLRAVESYVLNEHVTAYIAKQAGQASGRTQYLPAVGPQPRKTIRHPEWLGFALISVGAVLVLHALALGKPDG